MNKVQKIIKHAEQHCQENGVRLTEKRKKILFSLLSSGKALSAYELVDYCKERFDENMPAMSVYRILDFLENENLVHKLSLANKYVACAHISCDHEHEVPQFLICKQCQRVEEITINKSILEKLKSNVEQAGFQLATPQLEMNCYCKNCMTDAA